MVEHEDVIYVFGGELSFCNDQETPLWMYSIKVIIMMMMVMMTIDNDDNYDDNRITAGRSTARPAAW